MVAMGRALIADPFLPAKVAAGEAGDIIRCVGCNEGCVAGSARGTGIGCALNPLSGAEGKYDLDPVASSKKVAVIGGGPAGMRPPLPPGSGGIRWICMKNRIASAVCSTCLQTAVQGRFGPCHGLVRATVEAGGRRLHLGAALTPEAVRDLGADAVIVATAAPRYSPASAARPGTRW